MFNCFSVNEVARKLSITPDELAELLCESGIRCTDGNLCRSEIDALAAYLSQQNTQMEDIAKDYLAKSVRSYTILVDTCALLHDAFPLFAEHIAPLLKRSGKCLFVPAGVVNELIKKHGDPKLTAKAASALHILAQMQREGLAAVRGEADEAFADRQFLADANRLREHTSLLVITMDRGLSEDLLRLNEISSVRGKSLSVCRINRFGYLQRYRSPSRQNISRSYSTSACSVPSGVPVSDNSRLLPVSSVPKEGDTVCGDTETFRLRRKLASGGEGTIYDIGDGTVAKIYHVGKLTETRRDKLGEMVRTHLTCEGVCMPTELLYSGGTFVGYRMEKAEGVELQRGLFTRPALERNFPKWNKRDMVQLCVTILEKICCLHSHGILLGDINPRNILVKSPTEVWFVDCDSYQIGNYPCPVGTVRFTAPEIQKRSFSGFLRSESQESFAVATLLFMLMLPGKSPYAQQGGEDISEAIVSMNFPYGCGMTYTENIPDGDWRFIWSHLPYFIKKDFAETFRRGGRYSAETTRLPLASWLSEFNKYLDLLDSGKLEARDAESLKIFPTRGKQITQDAGEIVQTVCCCDCGESFSLTRGERDYMEQYNLVLPKRCPRCRELRRLCRHMVSGEGA